MKFLALTLHALRSTLSQKIIIGILCAVAILFLIVIFTVHIDTENGAISSASVYGSKPMTGSDFPYILPKLAEIYTTMYFLSALVLGIIATAQIVPDAINNRTFILYLSRPISRRSVIIAIFTGVTTAIVIVQVIFIIGFGIIFTAKTGIWNLNLLMSVIPLIVGFGSLYAMMVYAGIIGKSTGLVTGLAMGHVLLISHMLSSRENHLLSALGYPFYDIFLGIVRIILPAVHELQQMSLNIIMSRPVNMIIVFISLLPCALYLWLSVRAFRRMDF
jgi:ABC-type transport system involved in multi-copper enzyme maturation permease subunit